MTETVVIVNGPPRAGKDSFVDLCMEELEAQSVTCSKWSSVDRVKHAARLLGWDGEKDAAGRQFLSDLKDLSTRAVDGPLRYMLERITTRQHNVMFFHVREPEEIVRMREALPAGVRCVTLFIDRPGVPEFGNHADGRVREMRYDCTVHNDGTLQDLARRAYTFAHSWLSC